MWNLFCENDIHSSCISNTHKKNCKEYISLEKYVLIGFLKIIGVKKGYVNFSTWQDIKAISHNLFDPGLAKLKY